MPTEPRKPLIVISYAHADEPEHPAEGEVKWLSFVTGYLRPAIKHGAADLWIDRLMLGSSDWEPEIEQKLRACDIFVLLVSRHSMASDYVVDKEIAIIRERQAKGEAVHFYPLVLTPTPKIALDLVRDKNLRPRDGKPLSNYREYERWEKMNEIADEIAELTTRNRKVDPTSPNSFQTEMHAGIPLRPVTGSSRLSHAIRDRLSLLQWLSVQKPPVRIAVAARAALRVLPLTVPKARGGSISGHALHFLSSALRVTAAARVAVKGQGEGQDLRVAVEGVAGSTASAANAAAESAAWSGTAALDGSDRAAASAVECAAAAGTFEAMTLHAEEPTALNADKMPIEDAGAYASVQMWREAQADAEKAERSDASVLLNTPLWTHEMSDWANVSWSGTKAALPQTEDWEVWIDWYEERLRGGARGEEYELVFASVPQEEWDKGPAAANA